MVKLNEHEESHIKRLVDDPALMQVVVKVARQVIDNNTPVLTEYDGNEIIGEKYRAYRLAEQIINEVFDELEHYKSSIPEEPSKPRGL